MREETIYLIESVVFLDDSHKTLESVQNDVLQYFADVSIKNMNHRTGRKISDNFEDEGLKRHFDYFFGSLLD
jgi:hypothetical protein